MVAVPRKDTVGQADGTTQKRRESMGLLTEHKCDPGPDPGPILCLSLPVDLDTRECIAIVKQLVYCSEQQPVHGRTGHPASSQGAVMGRSAVQVFLRTRSASGPNPHLQLPGDNKVRCQRALCAGACLSRRARPTLVRLGCSLPMPHPVPRACRPWCCPYPRTTGAQVGRARQEAAINTRSVVSEGTARDIVGPRSTSQPTAFGFTKARFLQSQL